MKKQSYFKSINVRNFRALKKQPIEIGRKLTLISGRNGTGKSTILGLLAQMCNFRSRYEFTDETRRKAQVVESLTNYKTVYSKPFYSVFRNHFKISTTFDRPESDYLVDSVFFDADLNEEIHATLQGGIRTLNNDEDELRLVQRQHSSIGILSRNYTFPTIYLSLGRLIPIVDRQESLDDAIFTDDEKELLIELDRNVFNSPVHSNRLSSNNPSKSVSSSVVTGDHYDINSASSGEDNIGQIIAAMLSFVRLKKEYADYAGGLLLIDELDASLFPAAEEGILKVLNRFSTKYSVQVVFTSHSPQLIKTLLQMQMRSSKDAKTKADIGFNYFDDDTTPISVHSDWPAQKVLAKLDLKMPAQKQQPAKVNVYVEDSETKLALKSVLNAKLMKAIHIQNIDAIGGDQLLALGKLKIPEFSTNSLIIIDGDKTIPRSLKNFVTLPFSLPPDQMLYHLLSQDSPALTDYWNDLANNDIWSKGVFYNDETYKSIQNRLQFVNHQYVAKAGTGIKPRDLFKKWFKANEKQLKLQRINPLIQLWKPAHGKGIADFNEKFAQALQYVRENQTYYL